jgi:hypothetical protein
LVAISSCEKGSISGKSDCIKPPNCLSWQNYITLKMEIILGLRENMRLRICKQAGRYS